MERKASIHALRQEQLCLAVPGGPCDGVERVGESTVGDERGTKGRLCRSSRTMRRTLF